MTFKKKEEEFLMQLTHLEIYNKMFKKNTAPHKVTTHLDGHMEKRRWLAANLT